MACTCSGASSSVGGGPFWECSMCCVERGPLTVEVLSVLLDTCLTLGFFPLFSGQFSMICYPLLGLPVLFCVVHGGPAGPVEVRLTRAKRKRLCAPCP